MKNGEDYLEEIKGFEPHIYCCGKKVSDYANHPLIRPVINTARATYDMALDPECKDMMSARSSLTGEDCNLLSALFEDKEDLIRSVKLRRWWQNQVGTCNAGRCAGTCVANAVHTCKVSRVFTKLGDASFYESVTGSMTTFDYARRDLFPGWPSAAPGQVRGCRRVYWRCFCRSLSRYVLPLISFPQICSQ